MTTANYLPKIRRSLQRPLPGWEIQKLMAPEARLTIDRNMLIRSDHKEGGVLLLLYPGQDDQLYLVLMRRPAYNGVHSAQVSFPGGAREPDESLQTTALREANEEIGVTAQSVRLLGALSPVYIPPSNFMVYPYVAYHPAHPLFIPNQREVAELIEVPVAMLFEEGIQGMEQMVIHQVGKTPVPYYNFFGHKVWGATAMILREFKELLQND